MPAFARSARARRSNTMALARPYSSALSCPAWWRRWSSSMLKSKWGGAGGEWRRGARIARTSAANPRKIRPRRGAVETNIRCIVGGQVPVRQRSGRRAAEHEAHSLRRVDEVHLHAGEQGGGVAVDE